MVNDNLERRGLYTEVFPQGSKVIKPVMQDSRNARLPSMPIPFDTNVTPTRALKKQYRTNQINLKAPEDDDFNFVIRMSSDDGFANLYALIKVGQPITFSYQIDSDDTFTFPFENFVNSVSISNSQIEFDLFCLEAIAAFSLSHCAP